MPTGNPEIYSLDAPQAGNGRGAILLEQKKLAGWKKTSAKGIYSRRWFMI